MAERSRPVLNALKDLSSTGHDPSELRMREARTLNDFLPAPPRLVPQSPEYGSSSRAYWISRSNIFQLAISRRGRTKTDTRAQHRFNER